MPGDNTVAFISDEPDEGRGDGVVDAEPRGVVVVVLASLPVGLSTRRRGEVPALWGERAADGSRSGGGKGERRRRRRAVAAEVCSSGAEREGSEAAPESHIPFPRLASLA